MLDIPNLFQAHMPTSARTAEPDIVELLYEAARTPQRWPDTLARLAAHVGAESAMMARCDLVQDLHSVVADSDSPVGTEPQQASVEVWRLARTIAGHMADEPKAVESGDARVIAVPAAADSKRAYLVLPHPNLCGGGCVAWIGVALPAARPSPNYALRRFSSLRGHLARALDISTELAQAREAKSSLAILLSALPTAALMLDEGGRVMHANSAAQAILDDGDGIRRTGDRRLRVGMAGEDRTLAPALRSALTASRGGQRVDRLAVRLRRSAGRSPLLVILDPISPAQRAIARDRSGAVLLRMIDEDHPSDDRNYPLQAAFDLTAAEMRIAALIAAGLSTTQAARRLNLSTNTVRTHLARIFDKTGVRSQQALTMLLAAIGSWPVP